MAGARPVVGWSAMLIALFSCGVGCDDDARAPDDATSSASATSSGSLASAGGADSSSGGAGGALEDIPAGVQPCDAEELWPLELRSSRYPVVVHYRSEEEAEMSADVLAAIETSWEVEVEGLGFRAPLPDGGRCGSDDAFDVFVHRGIEECYVEALAERPETAWDDWTSFMVVDPWGPYGGPLLGSTLSHEFNHACQATDDWSDAPLVYEMTATFIEDVVFDDVDVYLDLLEDFQSRPDWALDYDDAYETWYMYGAALYLSYLRDRFFDGDASFAADLWWEMRSEPGAGDPDFVDALEAILAPVGSTYASSVAEFARWRWYTGARDDGAHFEEGARFPATADVAATVVTAGTTVVDLDPAPMITGSAYITVNATPDGPTMLEVELEAAPDPEIRWMAQVLPGTAGDGDVLDLSAGPALLDLGGFASRTVVVTALPAGDYDPDERSDAPRPATLRFTARQ